MMAAAARSPTRSRRSCVEDPMDHRPTGRAAIDREFLKPKRTFHNVVKGVEYVA